ncbi:helix-turn-helix domain-containing protein [Sinorhizobium meliloti]|uniref:helix-turn-helix domain-containing protein n=1 Tax=Rhizobium meliloti TaxID=382 RepID=UPI001297E183|nr:helix-turn-helix transcriptional regulator [Sinorhizobium meliloti]MQX74645.1 helix-turn-helix domain-containing protein [Sinorhizobium meliloti]
MKGRELLAWNVRHLRVQRGLSQEVLAADASVDRAYLAKVERLEANAGVDVLDKLAAALGVDIVDLFASPTEGAKPPQVLRGGRKAKRKQ